MQRNSFLKLSAVLASSLLVPFGSWAKKLTKKRIGKAIKTAAGKDRFDKPITLFEGDTFFTKVASADTDNDLYIWESTRIKKGGPTEHFHYSQDEWWYILEGEFLFKVGDETFTAKKGDSVFGPRMVPHTFAKTNDGEAKLLMLFQPAGKMEIYFKAVSGGATKSMTDEERNEFKKQHGFETTGPALIYEKRDK
jgi:mannose-6-phosphate isomerase-like protein (cupin superfamily)